LLLDETEQDVTDESDVRCPYCDEQVRLILDAGGGDVQQYVEDCSVCCNPWDVVVWFHPNGSVEVTLRTLDE
jgi:hypothetical protein